MPIDRQQPNVCIAAAIPVSVAEAGNTGSQACDRVDTIDRVALDRNADATAATLAHVALSTEALKSG